MFAPDPNVKALTVTEFKVLLELVVDDSITPEQARASPRVCCQHDRCGDVQVDAMISEVDDDQSGLIEFAEFNIFMCHLNPDEVHGHARCNALTCGAAGGAGCRAHTGPCSAGKVAASHVDGPELGAR